MMISLFLQRHANKKYCQFVAHVCVLNILHFGHDYIDRKFRHEITISNPHTRGRALTKII